MEQRDVEDEEEGFLGQGKLDLHLTSVPNRFCLIRGYPTTKETMESCLFSGDVERNVVGMANAPLRKSSNLILALVRLWYTILRPQKICKELIYFVYSFACPIEVHFSASVITKEITGEICTLWWQHIVWGHCCWKGRCHFLFLPLMFVKHLFKHQFLVLLLVLCPPWYPSQRHWREGVGCGWEDGEMGVWDIRLGTFWHNCPSYLRQQPGLVPYSPTHCDATGYGISQFSNI